jgi:predicted DNA-binding transcriptional regulator AlpA
MTGGPPLLLPFSALKPMGISLSLDTIRRLWRTGKFPVPVRLGHHHLAWRAKDIETYLANLPPADSMPLVQSRGRRRKQ